MLTAKFCKAKLQWYPFAPAIALALTAFIALLSTTSAAQEKLALPAAVTSTTETTKVMDKAIEKAALKPCPPLENLKDNTKTTAPNFETPPAAEPPCLPAPIIVPHIALFLPLANKAFANVATAVKTGFTTAASTDGAPALAYRIYAVENEADSLATAYHKAAAEGAIVAVAALTRDGATRIAKEGGSLPTLALNAPAADVGTPKLFYYLSLNIDIEARQTAQLAITDGFTSAVMVTGNTALAKRVRDSFEREFLKLGREIKSTVALSGDAQDSNRVRQGTERIRFDAATDMIFLALDAPAARALRPYLPGGIPVYAPSMSCDARAGQVANLDLESVRLLEMPWSVQPDHPAVMIYAKPDQSFSTEQERLYALGVDAWRVASLIASNAAPKSGTAGNTSASRLERQLPPVDGVTGKLVLDMTTRQFIRSLTAIEMRSGRPVLYRGAE